MSPKPSKREQTREHILDAAGEKFREHGFAGTGVDGVARAAGVTSGAFYAHFGSKDGAFEAALDAGLNEVIAAVPNYQEQYGTEWTTAFVDYYLSKAHRDDLACGCAMTTLSPEVVRAAPAVHVAYEAKMKKIADLIADGLKGGSEDERHGRAWAMLGTLIGGLTMTRAVKSKKAAAEIATAVKAAAIAAAGPAR